MYAPGVTRGVYITSVINLSECSIRKARPRGCLLGRRLESALLNGNDQLVLELDRAIFLQHRLRQRDGGGDVVVALDIHSCRELHLERDGEEAYDGAGGRYP